jgi:hypothetical protein
MAQLRVMACAKARLIDRENTELLSLTKWTSKLNSSPVINFTELPPITHFYKPAVTKPWLSSDRHCEFWSVLSRKLPFVLLQDVRARHIHPRKFSGKRSSVGVLTRLWAERSGVGIPDWAQRFSLLPTFQNRYAGTSSGDKPAWTWSLSLNSV